MLRSKLFDLSPLALGASVAFHAAALVVSGQPGPASPTNDETVNIDVVADPVVPVTPDPAATFSPPVEHAVTTPTPLRANAVATNHDGARVAEPHAMAASAAATPSGAEDADLPIFAVAIGPTTNLTNRGASPGASPSGNASVHDAGHEASDVPSSEDAVDVRARLVRGTPPAYPSTARSSGVEGDVVLELIVGVLGAVESARVLRGVGHGLDEAALGAASNYRFAPASKAGQPVRVRMLWPMRFRLD